jgi:hypothetical protein
MQLPMKGFLNLEQSNLALYSLSFHLRKLDMVLLQSPLGGQLAAGANTSWLA